MKNSKLSRRDFLRELGASSLALPILPSLLTSENAYGQTTSGFPLRVVFIQNGNGQARGTFFPPNLPQMTQHQPNVSYCRLSDIPGTEISPLFSSQFNRFRDKISLISGLDLIANSDHNRTLFACSVGIDNSPMSFLKMGASADWIIEKSTNMYPTAPKIRAIRFYSGEDGDTGRFSFSNIGGVIKALEFTESDSALFNQVFSSIGGTTPDALQVRRQNITSKVIERLQLIKNNSRLSGVDKTRMQAHTDMMNNLMNTFVPTPIGGTCRKPTLTFQDSPHSKKYSNVNDIIVNAFNCDLTRVACYSIPDYHDTLNAMTPQHDASHLSAWGAELPDQIREFKNMNAWKALRVLDLLTKLDSVVEGTGTMLDNTLVIWGNESGETITAHRMENLPIMIAGGRNIPLKFGYFVDYQTKPYKYVAGRDDFPPAGRPYNGFLATIMLACGIKRSEFEVFGSNGKFGEFNTAALYEYNLTRQYEAYRTNYTDPLPFLYTGSNV